MRGKILTGGELKKFLEEHARKGGRVRSARVTKSQRRASARLAAQALWEKHRAGQKRQPKTKPEPIIIPGVAFPAEVK